MKRIKGARRLPDGWQVFARRNGKFLSKRLPASATPRELKRARERLVGQDFLAEPTDTSRAFEDDASDYLQLVESMPSYADREHHILCWCRAFGRRPRKRITAREIRTVLEEWRLTGSKDGGPLSVASLNRRRTSLMHLYTTLDGRSQPNIVKDVPPFSEHHSELMRAQPMVTIARLIRWLRPWGKMRARLRVLMWTGWPHALLKTITPADIDWQRGRVRLAARHKGKGKPAAWIPVVPAAMRALKRFDALGCYGPFSNSSMTSALQRARANEDARRARLNLDPLQLIRVYDIRHSFGTWAASRVQDDRALKELLRTDSIARYTEGALEQRMEMARARLTAALLPEKLSAAE